MSLAVCSPSSVPHAHFTHGAPVARDALSKMVDSEQLSLALQFVASFCWAIGAALAGPVSVADFLQFLAAVAWCLANFASAWSMTSRSSAKMGDTSEEGLELH